MVEYFLLRDGPGEDRVTEKGTIKLDALKPLLKGRKLMKAEQEMPSITNPSVAAGKKLADYTGPSYVVIKLDDAREAKEIGATPGQHHYILGLKPAEVTAGAVIQ